jgi:hypothetical protein
MSLNLGGTPTTATNAAQISYDTNVKQAYQGAALLRPCVTVKSGVVGAAHNFRKFGKGVAQNHSSAELITPQDYSHAKVSCSLSNWRIGEYTDLFDQAETTVDERALLATANAMAIGRAEDQLIIDALDAATSLAGTVEEDLGGTNSGINADKLRRARRYLRAKGAIGKLTLVVNAIGEETALSETEVTSADYQQMKALVDAELDRKFAFGFQWRVMEDRVEGGLPTGSSNIRLCFAFDQAAVGLAVGMEPRTSVDWIPERAAHLSQAMQKAGSAVIDSEGVVEVQSYES